MIILDTNVISAMMMRRPEEAILSWVDRQHPRVIATTSVTVFEIRSGIEKLRDEPKRDFLEIAFRTGLRDVMQDRVLPLDGEAARQAGLVAGALHRMNRKIGTGDMLIAGIVMSNAATLATRNIRLFEGLGIALIDPWSAT